MRIDINKIDGYSEMTPEEKVTYFESFEYEDKSEQIDHLEKELERYKAATTKANSEAASRKREHQEFLKTNDEELGKLKTEIENLKREKEISNSKNQFMSMGFPEELAGKSATALFDGNFSDVFNHTKDFLKLFEQKVRADSLRDTPKPTSGSVSQAGEETAGMKRARAYAEKKVAEIKAANDILKYYT